MIFKTAIGQSSHRFLPEDLMKPCMIGGLIFEGVPGLSAASDGDVVFHALCQAITSAIHVPILGGVAKELCLKDGITDSQVYVQEGLKLLSSEKISFVSLVLEGKRPEMEKRVEEMRKNVAAVLRISVEQIGITINSGDGLTPFSLGEGISCMCLLTLQS